MAVDPETWDGAAPAKSLAGAVALVTGSSSGIGAAVARELGSHGTRVVLNSASSPSAGEALAGELPEAVYVQGDVSRDDEAARLPLAAVDRWDRLDLVVNCAGTTAVVAHDDLEAVPREMWDRTLGVNLIGPWNVVRASLPHLRRSDAAAVINVSSVAGLRPSGSSVPYAVSKAALNHLTLLLANALAPAVRVNAVAPGFVDTPWTAGWDELRGQVESRTPMGRVGRPEDIAQACVALARSPYITGQVLAVDGGLSLR